MTDILETLVDKKEIGEKLIELAKAGDLPALKYIYDRIDGRPKESVDIAHSGGTNMIYDPVLDGSIPDDAE